MSASPLCFSHVQLYCLCAAAVDICTAQVFCLEPFVSCSNEKRSNLFKVNCCVPHRSKIIVQNTLPARLRCSDWRISNRWRNSRRPKPNTTCCSQHKRCTAFDCVPNTFVKSQKAFVRWVGMSWKPILEPVLCEGFGLSRWWRLLNWALTTVWRPGGVQADLWGTQDARYSWRPRFEKGLCKKPHRLPNEVLTDQVLHT